MRYHLLRQAQQMPYKVIVVETWLFYLTGLSIQPAMSVYKKRKIPKQVKRRIPCIYSDIGKYIYKYVYKYIKI